MKRCTIPTWRWLTSLFLCAVMLVTAIQPVRAEGGYYTVTFDAGAGVFKWEEEDPDTGDPVTVSEDFNSMSVAEGNALGNPEEGVYRTPTHSNDPFMSLTGWEVYTSDDETFLAELSWNGEGESEESVVNAYVPDRDVRLVAIYGYANLLNIKLHANGGKFIKEEYVEGQDDPVQSKVSECNGTLPAGQKFGVWESIECTSDIPEREGYVLVGWADADGNPVLEWDYEETRREDAYSSYEVTEGMELYAIWREAYTVTFNANGGEMLIDSIYNEETGDFDPYYAETNQLVVPKGNSLMFRSEGDYRRPARDGYGLVGWTATTSGGEEIELTWDNETTNEDSACWEYVPTENITFTANWEAVRTVTFNPNGGKFTDYREVEVEDPATGEMTIEYEEYETTDPNVMTVIKDRYLRDKVEGEYRTPHREGALLSGWATDAAGKDVVITWDDVETSESMAWPAHGPVSEDATLYAVWGDAVTVTFHAGEGYIESNDYEYDEETGESFPVKLDENAYTVLKGRPLSSAHRDYHTAKRDGYILIGWQDANGETILEWDEFKNTYEEDVCNAYCTDESIDLYPIWVEGWTVTFDANGGDFVRYAWNEETEEEEEIRESRREVAFRAGGRIGWQYDSPEKEGMALVGWASDQAGEHMVITWDNIQTTEHDASARYVPAANNETLYAVWKDAYTVTFDAGEGYFWKSYQEDADGNATEEPHPIAETFVEKGKALGSLYISPKHDGTRVLAGWNDADGNPVLRWDEDTTETEVCEAYVPTADIRLNAVWADAYIVNFDPNGGMFVFDGDGVETYSEDVEPDKVAQGSALGWYWSKLKRDGYTFVGWATDQAGENMVSIGYEALQAYVPTEDVTLYAIWKEGTAPKLAAPTALAWEHKWADSESTYATWQPGENAETDVKGYRIWATRTDGAEPVESGEIMTDGGLWSEDPLAYCENFGSFVAKQGGGTFTFSIQTIAADGSGKDDSVVVTSDPITLYRFGVTLKYVQEDGVTPAEDPNSIDAFLSSGSSSNGIRGTDPVTFYLQKDQQCELEVGPDVGYEFSGVAFEPQPADLAQNGQTYTFTADANADVTVTIQESAAKSQITVDFGSGHEAFAGNVMKQINEEEAGSCTIDGAKITFSHIQAAVSVGDVIEEAEETLDDLVNDGSRAPIIDADQLYMGIAPKAISAYKNEGALHKDVEAQQQVALPDEITLYALWADPLPDGASGAFTLAEPACGTVVELIDKVYDKAPTVRPGVTTAESSFYDVSIVYGSDERDAEWLLPEEPETSSTLFEGTMVGGTTYTARFRIEPKFGYYDPAASQGGLFPPVPGAGGTLPSVKVNGKPAEVTQNHGGVIVEFQIKAVHDWGPASYVWAKDNSTVTATRTCKAGCKQKETETVKTTYDAVNGRYTAVFTNKAFTNQTKVVRIPVTGITLDKTAEVQVGKTVKPKAAVTPSNATNKKVTWKSADESIATVNASGVVTGKKVGETTVTATTDDGKKTATCKVTVSFTDVPRSGKYYSEPVYWAVKKNITNGYTDKDGLARTFKPADNCTRAQMVTFLWRHAGKPNPKTKKNPFKDVKSNAYYYKAVLWAVEKGITKGYAGNVFKPDAPCQREHAVTFLWRYAGKPNVSSKKGFKDVKTKDYYYKAVLWAVNKGITKGYSDGTFKPKADCQREHIVTFLYRYKK